MTEKELNHKYYLTKRKRILKATSLYRKKNQRKYTLWQIKWNKEHPNSVMNTRLKIRFGITLEQYLKLFKKQDGKCAICKNKEQTISNYSNKPRSLSVDHCHKTDEIRGLLCNNCNSALGRFNDNIQVLQNAIKYLRKY